LARIFFSSTRHEPGLRQGAGGEAENLRHGDPLDLPRAGGALVVLHHGIEQGGDVLAHQRIGCGDVDRGDRVALLRHRARRSPALVERLIDLFDFGLHHQLHVEGDFAAHAGDEAEKAADLGDAIADGVPRR
jgi:hypothetical protein